MNIENQLLRYSTGNWYSIWLFSIEWHKGDTKWYKSLHRRRPLPSPSISTGQKAPLEFLKKRMDVNVGKWELYKHSDINNLDQRL